MKKIENRRVYISPSYQSAIDEMLTEMGDQGFTMVQLDPRNGRHDFYFTRPRPAKRQPATVRAKTKTRRKA